MRGSIIKRGGVRVAMPLSLIWELIHRQASVNSNGLALRELKKRLTGDSQRSFTNSTLVPLCAQPRLPSQSILRGG